MIWVDGKIRAADQWAIPLGDRIFEHGLGLFETLRTWRGRTLLLERHLARLRRSAAKLGIDLAGVRLPDPSAVANLTRAVGLPDAVIRLTVTAGRRDAIPPTAWMTANHLPPDSSPSGYRVVDAPWPVAVEDLLARHKTLNYWAKRLACDHARDQGADEAIIASADGRIWEGSRTNLFLIHGEELISPPLTGPIVPGVLRGLVFEHASRAGFAISEANLTDADVDTADTIFLTNSVRGVIPVQSWAGRFYRPIDPHFAALDRLRRAIAASWNPEELDS